MEFRRTTNPAPRGSVRRKGVALLVSVGVLALLVYLVIQDYRRGQIPVLTVEMQSTNRYLIEDRTTNYEDLASTLRAATTDWQRHKRRYIIELQLSPNVQNSDTLRAVLQLVSAFDVPWQLKQ